MARSRALCHPTPTVSPPRSPPLTNSRSVGDERERDGDGEARRRHPAVRQRPACPPRSHPRAAVAGLSRRRTEHRLREGHDQQSELPRRRFRLAVRLNGMQSGAPGSPRPAGRASPSFDGSASRVLPQRSRFDDGRSEAAWPSQRADAPGLVSDHSSTARDRSRNPAVVLLHRNNLCERLSAAWTSRRRSDRAARRSSRATGFSTRGTRGHSHALRTLPGGFRPCCSASSKCRSSQFLRRADRDDRTPSRQRQRDTCGWASGRPHDPQQPFAEGPRSGAGRREPSDAAMIPTSAHVR